MHDYSAYIFQFFDLFSTEILFGMWKGSHILLVIEQHHMYQLSPFVDSILLLEECFKYEPIWTFLLLSKGSPSQTFLTATLNIEFFWSSEHLEQKHNFNVSSISYLNISYVECRKWKAQLCANVSYQSLRTVTLSKTWNVMLQPSWHPSMRHEQIKNHKEFSCIYWGFNIQKWIQSGSPDLH